MKMIPINYAPIDGSEYERGKVAERSKIVAWLREDSNDTYAVLQYCQKLADCIERGDHDEP